MIKRRKKKSPCTHRAHLFYSGRVQGVGFRYTAERIAEELDLVGWVKNLSDNRVELVCEGPRESIKLMRERIQKSILGPYIKKTTFAWEKPSGQFTEFRIEFCV